MPPAPLSDIERKILDFMVLYLRTNTYQPSIREIGERFGIKSTKTVSEHLQALAEKGYLERDPSRSRGVRILGVDLAPQTVSIPCFIGLPQGRNGSSAETAEMYLSLDRRIAGAKGSFFVRMTGGVLEAVGLSEGDFVLVEPADAEQLASGDLIAARIGDEPAFYRYLRGEAGVSLVPPGGGEPALEAEGPAKLEVLGKVAALYRRMDGVQTVPTATTH